MIYADYNGSAPLLPAVRDYLRKRLESDLYANPNAIHSLGQKVSKGIEKCRALISECVGAHPDQIIFNSGSSEGLSQIIYSVLEYAPVKKNIIIMSAIEHVVLPSAFNTYVQNRKFQLKIVPVDASGKIQLGDLERLLLEFGDRVALVSVMAANNETGVVQPYQKIARLCREKNIDYLCDTTQLIGKGEFHFLDSGVDYAVCSGHKLGALPGSGFLMVREPQRLKSFVFGSTQEQGKRGGTQNYLGIETLAVALKDFTDHKGDLKLLAQAREAFEDRILKTFPKAVVIGKNSERLSGTTLIGYPGIHGQAVQIELESQDIFVTTSAACTDNQPETSKVLKAMAVDDQLGRSVIRISLSYSHGEKDYSRLESALTGAYNKLTKISY